MDIPSDFLDWKGVQDVYIKMHDYSNECTVYICLLCLQMSTTLSSSSTLSQCHEMEATWYQSAINIILKHSPYQTLIPHFPKTNLQVANCCLQKRYGHGLGTKWFHHHTHGPASEFLIEEGTGGGCWANSHSPGHIQK